MTLEFVLNDRPVSAEVDPLARLLDVLRNGFGLHGVKEGCGEGECGACAVLVDGRLVNSCIVPAATIEGSRVLTIEGYRTTDRFTVIERALAETGGVQCGFCTPGIVMATESILREHAHPSDEEIRHGLSGNLCRCTGYETIVRAVRIASERVHDDEP